MFANKCSAKAQQNCWKWLDLKNFFSKFKITGYQGLTSTKPLRTLKQTQTKKVKKTCQNAVTFWLLWEATTCHVATWDNLKHTSTPQTRRQLKMTTNTVTCDDVADEDDPIKTGVFLVEVWGELFFFLRFWWNSVFHQRKNGRMVGHEKALNVWRGSLVNVFLEKLTNFVLFGESKVSNNKRTIIIIKLRFILPNISKLR